MVQQWKQPKWLSLTRRAPAVGWSVASLILGAFIGEEEDKEDDRVEMDDTDGDADWGIRLLAAGDGP